MKTLDRTFVSERARLREQAARLRVQLAESRAENSMLDAEVAAQRALAGRLSAEKSELIRVMASEAFKIKNAGDCYSACPMARIRDARATSVIARALAVKDASGLTLADHAESEAAIGEVARILQAGAR